MGFLWPGSLFSLALVGAVAAWALFRPSRRLAVVGSLELWAEALAALGRSARTRSRRITASWVLLLAGAVAAGLGLARPVVHTESPARRLAISVCPSAELGRSGETLRQAVGGLLDRLDAGDRVRILRPAVLGGPTDWLTVAAARRVMGQVPVLPAPAEDVTVPRADDVGGLIAHFVPAGHAGTGGGRVAYVELPSRLPPSRIESLGAADVGGGTAQLFVSIRNDGPAVWNGPVRVAAPADALAEGNWPEIASQAVSVPAGVVRPFVLTVRAAGAFRVALGEGDEAAGFLARRDARRRKVALTGRDEPLLRRFLKADEALEWVASPAEADVVLANRAGAPAGKPALVIDPPTNPSGWGRGAEVSAVVLRDANVAADHPVLRGVDLASAAVRRLRPWVATGPTRQRVLIARQNGALALARDADALGASRRVYVAFELNADNTNLGISEAFVVFLANAVRWLAPAGGAEVAYESLSAAQAIGAGRWQRLAGRTPEGLADAPLPWPGVFRDEAGDLRAVSLVGLAAGRSRQSPEAAVSAVPLPAPEAFARAVELWPVLAAAAAALWLAGWWARLR